MLDVEPVIVEELERLDRALVGSSDWTDVLARAQVRTAGGRGRRLAVAAAAVAAASALVAVAIAAALGGFSSWLTGEPGSPASKGAQAAFTRATRSWDGFPRTAQLRKLVETTVGGAHYELYGFRGAGSLCLRLRVTGSPSGNELACAPLAELRARTAPALVVANDVALGDAGRMAVLGPFRLPRTQVSVTFGVVADGVDTVSVRHRRPTSTRTVVGGDAFLSVTPGLSPFDPVARIEAGAGGRTVAVPFTADAGVAGLAGGAPPVALPAAKGPSAPTRVVRSGAIRWFARRQPRGTAVPRSVHHIVGVLPDVIFARLLTPDPSLPERVVASIRPAGNVYFGGRLRNKLQVCAELVGGRYVGGGCWPAGRLFSTEPFTAGLAEQTGSQTVALAGLASDDVARLRLFAATGAVDAVPLHDNAYVALGTRGEFPLRLVAYDMAGRVIGVKTFKGDRGGPPSVGPDPGAPWRRVLVNGAGAVYETRSATGGACVGFRFSSGAVQIGCDLRLGARQLVLGTNSGGGRRILAGQVGADVARITVNGVPVTTSAGYVLREVPGHGRVTVVGFDAAGRHVARLVLLH